MNVNVLTVEGSRKSVLKLSRIQNMAKNSYFIASHVIEKLFFSRTLTRKTANELKKKQAESDLQQSIVERCNHYGFQYRFLYQSVIVTTPLSDWCFDYHHNKITLYHESTTKINFATGD